MLSASNARRLLLIAEDGDTREAMKAVLLEEGYLVDVVANGAAALERLHDNVFDLVLADLFGPGEAALREAEALLREAHPTPVGIVTAWPVDEPSAVSRGFAFAMQQPIDLARLFGSVARTLGSALPADAPEAEVLRRYFAALSQRDWDALVSLCTEDVVYQLPGTGFYARTVEGRTALRSFSEETFAGFPQACFRALVGFPTPTGVAARFESEFVDPQGATQRLTGALVLKLAGPSIERILVQMNEQVLEKRAGR